MIRFLDVVFSLLGLFFGFPVLLVIYLFGLYDTGSPLFKQKRVGLNKKSFVVFIIDYTFWPVFKKNKAG